MRKFALTALAAAMAAFLQAAPAQAVPEEVDLPKIDWSWQGVFGTFDRAELQRGFQVYKEVCAACHSVTKIAFRNLVDIGFSVDQVKEIAAEFEVEDGPDDEGEMFTREAKPADRFPSPYPNDNAAAALNDGAIPPDLSLITKARRDGANYLYGLLTGYEEAPDTFDLAEGKYYNPIFPGKQIAMPKPIEDESVEYADGTEATLEQQSRDVTAFLAWAAEPELEARKSLGLKVLLFLIVLTAMLYAIKRRIWKDVH